MADTITLNAEKRDMDKNPRQIRQEGLLTGTIYGKGMDSVSIQLNAKSFIQEFKKNPESNFTVVVDGKSFNAKVMNVQENYATAQKMNVEFKAV